MKKLWPLLIVAAIIPGCAKSIVQPKVEDAIENALPKYIGPAKSYKVRTAGHTAQMLGGKLDLIKIDGVDVQVDPSLTLSKLYVEMSDVRVDTDTRALKAVGSTFVRATISEKAVNHYIKETRDDLDMTVKLEEGKIVVNLSQKVVGVGIPLSVTGNLALAGRDKVDFHADAAAIGRLPFPSAVVNKGLARVNPVLDLSILKFPIILKDIVIHKGAAEVTGNAEIVRDNG